MNRGFLSNSELHTANGRVYYYGGMIMLVILAIVTLFPFFFAFTSGLKGSTEIFSAGLNLLPETPLWSNYNEAWMRFDMPRLFVPNADVTPMRVNQEEWQLTMALRGYIDVARK